MRLKRTQASYSIVKSPSRPWHLPHYPNMRSLTTKRALRLALLGCVGLSTPIDGSTSGIRESQYFCIIETVYGGRELLTTVLCSIVWGQRFESNVTRVEWLASRFSAGSLAMMDSLNPKVESQGNVPMYGTILVVRWVPTVSFPSSDCES